MTKEQIEKLTDLEPYRKLKNKEMDFLKEIKKQLPNIETFLQELLKLKEDLQLKLTNVQCKMKSIKKLYRSIDYVEFYIIEGKEKELKKYPKDVIKEWFDLEHCEFYLENQLKYINEAIKVYTDFTKELSLENFNGILLKLCCLLGE